MTVVVVVVDVEPSGRVSTCVVVVVVGCWPPICAGAGKSGGGIPGGPNEEWGDPDERGGGIAGAPMCDPAVKGGAPGTREGGIFDIKKMDYQKVVNAFGLSSFFEKLFFFRCKISEKYKNSYGFIYLPMKGNRDWK